MKIVINKQYGGFGISSEALKELYKRKAACIEIMTIEQYYGNGEGDKWEEDKKKYINIEDGIYKHPYGFNIWDENTNMLIDIKDDIEITRKDPDLVALVEDGKINVNARYSTLSVIEIPDDVEWYIHEYDGYESIHEKHRSWG